MASESSRHGPGRITESWESQAVDESAHRRWQTIRAAAEDRAFLRNLMRTMGKRLGRPARTLDELCQEALARGLEAESTDRYRPGQSSPRTYLVGIAANVAREAERRRVRETGVGSVQRRTDVSPLECSIAQERWERTLVQLGRLCPEDQLLIKRRFGLGCDPAEPASFSCRERARLCRALARLRTELIEKD
ncbi:MAG: sigma factor [Phycisphaerales bacterium]